MTIFSTKGKLHKRFSNFTTWIAPDASKREDMKTRRQKVREKIKAEAEKDGLIITATPNAGSFAKKTGLRRHYRGDSYVDGQDIDLPFVVKSETKDGKTITSLLDKFRRYVKKCYPNKDIEVTNSSVKLKFPDHVSFDIVPMLATEDVTTQMIIKKDGELVETSVQKHVDFIRSRIKDSDKEKGRVLFNECIRLFKWWKEFQADKGAFLYKTDSEDKSPSSFLIGLLCAKAYDELSVEMTYEETVARWSNYIADIVREKRPVQFTDYTPNVKEDRKTSWSVIDPVNEDNNVASKLNADELDELAEWFEDMRDNMPRIIRTHKREQETEGMEYLVDLFGNPFKHHCDN